MCVRYSIIVGCVVCRVWGRVCKVVCWGVGIAVCTQPSLAVRRCTDKGRKEKGYNGWPVCNGCNIINLQVVQTNMNPLVRYMCTGTHRTVYVLEYCSNVAFKTLVYTY